MDRSVWARLLQLEREDVDRVFVCGRALQARRSRVSRIEALQRKGPQEMAKKRHSRAVMGARLRLPVITLEALAPGVGLIFSGSIKKPGRKLLFSRSLLPESLAKKISIVLARGKLKIAGRLRPATFGEAIFDRRYTFCQKRSTPVLVTRQESELHDVLNG